MLCRLYLLARHAAEQPDATQEQQARLERFEGNFERFFLQYGRAGKRLQTFPPPSARTRRFLRNMPTRYEPIVRSTGCFRGTMTVPARSAVPKANTRLIACAVSSTALKAAPVNLSASARQNVMIWIRALGLTPIVLPAPLKARI